jgi:hypothetical protein
MLLQTDEAYSYLGGLTRVYYNSKEQSAVEAE